MYYIATTTKPVADAARDLEEAVKKHGFGVLHVHDLKETLTRKGHPLAAECRIFDVCNPRQASLVLQRDMRLNAALPCRISVYAAPEGGYNIATLQPTVLMQMFGSPELGPVAKDVEQVLKEMMADAAG